MGNHFGGEHVPIAPRQSSSSDIKFSAGDQLNGITIVHISDTHNLHYQLKLPYGDILIHTGDFSNEGTIEEYIVFNEYLGKVNIY